MYFWISPFAPLTVPKPHSSAVRILAKSEFNYKSSTWSNSRRSRWQAQRLSWPSSSGTSWPALSIPSVLSLVWVYTTVAAKWQSKIPLQIYSDDLSLGFYNHPYLQATSVFMGETLCLTLYFYTRHQRDQKYGSRLAPDEKAAVARGLTLAYNPLVFGIPVVFAIVSNALSYIGLANVRASVMQITMCTMIAWTAAFSFVFLKRRYSKTQYLALAAMVAGVSIVGLDAMLYNTEKGESTLFGIVCVIFSMMFIAMFFVVEEKLLSRYYAPPLQVVGVEGAIGAAACMLGLVAMYYFHCTPDPSTHSCPYGRFEDVPRALKEIGSNIMLGVAVVMMILSLGTYNAFGVTLTKYASATHRVAVNAVRPFAVWIVSMALGWEKFSGLQLAGYIMAIYGMLLYYSLIPLKIWKLCVDHKETGRTRDGRARWPSTAKARLWPREPQRK